MIEILDTIMLMIEKMLKAEMREKWHTANLK